MKTLLVATALAASLGAASASTMTFNDIHGGFQYVENGIVAKVRETIIGVGFAPHGVDDTLHLDDSATSWPSSVSFAMVGTSLFNAVSFDVLPAGYRVYVNDHGAEMHIPPWENVLVRGFRGNELVAEDAFAMGTQPFTYLFNSSFASISQLTIGFTPTAQFFSNGYFCDAPCSHFNIDNVTLVGVAPVPIPASLPLFATGLGVMGLLGWRRKRKVAR